MKSKGLLLTVALCTVGAIALLAQSQGQPPEAGRTAGVQGQADPNRAAFLMANCKNPPPVAAPRAAAAATGAPGGAPGAPAAAAGGGRGAGAGPQPDQDYTITAIPGVISADAKWTIIYKEDHNQWKDTGNNADGIVALDDGSLLLAQNDKSDVVQIDKNGVASVPYTDTYTGGSLAANAKGQLFVGERALHLAIWQLRPTRKLFANSYNGEPLDCLQGAGIINDMSADNKGGIYMTMGGIYYVNPQGVVLPRQDVPPVGGNGIILSPDGKTLYATGRVGGGARGGAAPAAAPAAGGAAPAGAAPAAGAPGAAGGGRGGGGGAMGGLVAWDVQPDGSLTNERQFADICGDGSTVDSEGRIYCTAARMPDPNDPTKMLAGIGVVSPQGKVLGIIPTPQGVISLAFGGPGKKTLFAAHIRDVEIMSIPMLSEGYKARPK